MKRFFILFALCLYSLVAYSQLVISGKITDESNVGVPFANVVMLDYGDSTLIAGTITDIDGNFSFETEKRGLLKVSCMGFEDYFSENPHENMPVIVLRKSDLMLDEISIVAERQKIQIKDGAMLTNVSGSPIAKLADIQHVLSIIPGIVAKNENITVLGKGEPLVYINNRKIRDLAEIYQLSPDNIKNIELITNPGAKYDSRVKSVLKINTIAPTGEGFSVDNKLSGGYQYKWYVSDNLKLNYRHKNLDVFASAGYSYKKYMENVFSTDETFLSSYYNMLTDDDNYYSWKPFSSKVGMNYDFKSGNSIGFTYSNSLSDNGMESNTITALRQDDDLADNLKSANSGDTKSVCHSINVYNSGSLLSWDYEVDFDAVYNYSDYNHLIDESSDAGEKILWDCDEENDASLYAFKTEFCKEVLEGDITIGTEHSFVNRKGICEYLQNSSNNSNCRVKERNSAIYSEFSQEFDNWGFTLGLRYEIVGSDYFEYEIRQSEYCRKYQNWFPSVSLDFSLGEADLSLSYDRSVQRPYYEQLGNNIGFVNRYASETGNPLLKPAYTDDFCANFVYKDLSFMADFFINYDYIYDSYTTYGDDAQISLIKPDNFDRFNSFQTSVAYNPTFGCYCPKMSASLYWQDMSIVFCGEKRDFDRPSGVFQMDNLIQLPWQTMLNVGLSYSTSGDYELGWIDDNFVCSLDVSKSIGNWTVSLVCDDVFETENQHFNMYGNIRKCTIEKHSDTRKIELSIRYKFNAAKSKYKGTGAGNEEKERM